MIPLYIVNEHNEALKIWIDAVKEGIIPSMGNVLLHVDEHSDMVTPQLNNVVKDLIHKDDDYIKNTVSQISIGAFIPVACYNGIFDRVYWVRRTEVKPNPKYFKRYVRSYNQLGKKLISNNVDSKTGPVEFDDPDRKIYDYYILNQEHITKTEPLVLDIDLDYFSCIDNPNLHKPILIEITKQEYDSFNSTNYHRLRFVGILRIETYQQDNRYYYRLNFFDDVYAPKLKVTQHEIETRIADFVSILNKQSVKPLMINICRSHYSGYTPADQWEFIEETLIKYLSQIYNIQLR